jgi:DME family drug/metabolite transporter
MISTNANERLGLLLAAVGTASLGLAIALSRIAYEGGTNGFTVASARTLLMLLELYLICRLGRRRLHIPLRDWLHCLGLGALMTLMAYGNVGSVEFIPVGLAALLFYTFPPVVAMIHAIVLRERLPLWKWLAVIIAFTGIALMLGVSLADSDWRGVALALSAGFATAWNAVWLMRKLPGRDPFVISFHMAAVAAPILLALSLFTGNIQLPFSPGGWFGLCAVAILQAAGLPLYFAAITRIGSLKTAMISNVQPLTSIVAAFLLYGELLSAPQFFGGALVLFGIWLMQWYDSRHSALSRAKPITDL